ncbi:MAG: hypothetical protein FWF41_02720 [Betaproteobacteria bacterium]|nr:hypothetical protein [Betaproteobacteria bacterium]
MSETQQRSTFVTVLAWVFIILSGIIAIVGIDGLQVGPSDRQIDIFGIWCDIQSILLALLLFSAFILITSIGLFKRCNWARLCAIGIMVLFLVYSLFWIVDVFSSSALIFPLGIFFLIISLGFFAFFSSAIGKLLSAPIAAEFGKEKKRKVKSEREQLEAFLAWVFITLSGIGVVAGVVGMVIKGFPLVFPLIFAFALTLSIGLFKRWNWTRLLLVSFFGFVVLVLAMLGAKF